MKIGSRTILSMTLLGLALLAVAPLYFHFPTFGWAIVAVEALVFLYGQERYRRGLLRLERDEADLEAVRGMDIPERDGHTLIARRIQQIRELAGRGVRPDARVFSEILSAEEGARGGRGPSGLVILLGLMGTFWGLMLSIQSAGGALGVQAGDQGTDVILNATRGLFSGMMGTFGTSLCGLVAALILNFCHSVLSSQQLRHMAEVEAFTQFQLLPAYFPSEAPEMKQMQALVQEMRNVSESLRIGLVEREKRTAEEFAHSVSELGKQLGAAAESSRKASETAAVELQNAVSAAAVEFRDAVRLSVGELSQASTSAAQLASSAASESTVSLRSVILEAGSQMSRSGDQLAERTLAAFSETASILQSSVKEATEAMARSSEDSSVRMSASVLSAGTKLSEAADAIVQSTHSASEMARGEVSRAAAEALSAIRGEALREMQSAAQEFSGAFRASAATLSEELAARWNEAAVRSAEPLRQLSESAAETGGQLAQILEAARQRVEGQADSVSRLDQSLSEAARLLSVNQAEFQASLDMFRKGVEALLGRLGGEGEQEQQRVFLERLEATLEAFQERAGEILSENALRTQEILLELLEQVRSGAR